MWIKKILDKLFLDDIKTLYKLCTDKEYRAGAKRQLHRIGDEGKRIGYMNIIKEYWMFYAMMAAFFFLSWGLAGAYYCSKCNEILLERGCVIITDALGNVIDNPEFKVMLLNLTNMTI